MVPRPADLVSRHLTTGHQRAVTAANTELVLTYWPIAREILERQEREGWGTKVIDRLSADLKRRFPEATGLSLRNLKYMRAFALAWPQTEIVQRSAAQLPCGTTTTSLTSWTVSNPRVVRRRGCPRSRRLARQ